MLCRWSSCSQAAGEKKTEVGVDDAVELLEKMSRTPLGVTYKADPANIKIEPTAKGSIITLSEPEITFDTAIYKELGMGNLFKQEKIPVKVKQLDLLYDPAKEYLEVLSLKDFSVDWDFTQREINSILKIRAQEMSFEDYNMSSLLDDKAKNFIEILMELIKQNPTIRSSIKGLNYEMISPVKSNRFSFLLSAEEMEWLQTGDPTPFLALFQKESDVSIDFAGILAGGSPVLDIQGHFRGLRFSVKEDGKELGTGKIAQSKFQYFLKPDKKKEFFTYAFSWDLESMVTSASGKDKKLIESLGNIKSLNMNFAFDHMTPAFIQAYFDLIRGNMALFSSGDEKKMNQVDPNEVMKIVGEMGKSKPIISYSMAPLKHYFGSMEAEANFQFQGMGTPVGKATVRIHNMDEVLKKMKDELSLQESVMASMQGLFVKDSKGDGVLTFEIKNEPAPGLYLNGQPMQL